MTGQPIQIRSATKADADAIADVFSPSLRLLTFLPELHTTDEDRWFIANIIMNECAVTLAEHEGSIISFLALERDEIRLLHTHPDHIGKGAGSLLLQAAKNLDLPALQLWCFQANMRARKFYERHGFRPVEFTDGARNEEKTPDVRYRWQRSP